MVEVEIIEHDYAWWIPKKLYIEKTQYLERRFASVHVNEPSADITVNLKGLQTLWRPPPCGNHWHQRWNGRSIIVRYIASRKLPDKAIDLMEEQLQKPSGSREW